MEDEQTEIRKVEYNCAVGIIENLMRKRMITPEECELIEMRLRQKYDIEDRCEE